MLERGNARSRAGQHALRRRRRLFVVTAVVGCVIRVVAACDGDEPIARSGSSFDAAPVTEASAAGDAKAPEIPACVPELLGRGPGKLSFGDDACNACVGAKCCEEFVSCYTTEAGTPTQIACFQLAFCLRPCLVAPRDAGTHEAGDAADADASAEDGGGASSCSDDCFAAYGAGAPLMDPLLECVRTQCGGDDGLCPQ